MRLRDALNDPLFRREGNRQIATPYAQALRISACVYISRLMKLFGDKGLAPVVFGWYFTPALNALPPVLAERSSSSGGDRVPLPFARRPGVMNCWIARLIWCWQLATIKSRSALRTSGGDDAFDRGFMARHCVHIWRMPQR